MGCGVSSGEIVRTNCLLKYVKLDVANPLMPQAAKHSSSVKKKGKRTVIGETELSCFVL